MIKSYIQLKDEVFDNPNCVNFSVVDVNNLILSSNLGGVFSLYFRKFIVQYAKNEQHIDKHLKHLEWILAVLERYLDTDRIALYIPTYVLCVKNLFLVLNSFYKYEWEQGVATKVIGNIGNILRIRNLIVTNLKYLGVKDVIDLDILMGNSFNCYLKNDEDILAVLKFGNTKLKKLLPKTLDIDAKI